MNALWTDVGTSGFADKKVYVVQTNPEVVRRCMLLATNPGDLVLDPTSGSGTTAVVAERTGRRWIVVDSSRVAVAIARSRILGQVYPYYLLADSLEGRETLRTRFGVEPPSGPVGHDVKRGFVYERTKHIRLRDIAYNTHIDTVDERFREPLDTLRAQACAGESCWSPGRCRARPLPVGAPRRERPSPRGGRSARSASRRLNTASQPMRGTRTCTTDPSTIPHASA
jgi:hypothetical protein